MAVPMTREIFQNFTNLGLALTGIFQDQLTAVADSNSLGNLFRISDSSQAAERNHGVGGFGNFREYTGALEYDSYEPLYRQTYTHREFAMGYAIERKAVDDDGIGVFSDAARKLGLAADRTVYTAMASVFNNAFTAGATAGADGVALCANNHPYSPTDTTTQSNVVTTPLTADSLIAAQQTMMSWLDSRGNPTMAEPDTLIVPVGLRSTALTIVGSAGRPGTANNDTNVVGGAFNVIVSRYLTDSNNWFLVDSRMAREYLRWYWRTRPEFVVNANSEYDLQVMVRGYMRYSFGFDHWNWILGANV
ncbi:MAG: hypothetical protein EBR82_34525 [Caulobacteraceae bacterium]|nr:hypothetical protein [Caulobacteraceae bacterium]